MGSKQCGKCGEVVDEAKAFCPGCGEAFVAEEKRTTVTDFDMSNKTVQLGGTMYNQLLSDMGLSIPKAASKADTSEAEPTASEPTAIPPIVTAPANPARSKWLVWAVAAAGVLFLLAVALLVILFLLWQRFA